MKYDFTSIIDPNSTHGIAVKHVRPNSKVLECGCASGYITNYLKNQLNCKVDIIEYAEDAFEIAKQFAEKGYCGSLNDEDWVEHFEQNSYDYILFMDVLEHLTDPKHVLTQSIPLLKEDGTVIVTLPNIAHNDILINLYHDTFNYQEQGLLDNTHIRFFALHNLEDFFKNTGVRMTSLEHTYLKTGRTEIFWNTPCKAPKELLNVLKSRENGDVYQFIITAKKDNFFEKHGLSLTVIQNKPEEYTQLIGIEDLNTLLTERTAEYDSVSEKLRIAYDDLRGAENELKSFKTNVISMYYNAWPDAPETDNFDALLSDLKERIRIEQTNNRRSGNALTQANRTIEELNTRCAQAEQNLYLIQNSRGHRLLNKYYGLRHTLLPVGSLRYKFVRILFKICRKVYRFIRKSPEKEPQIPVSNEAPDLRFVLNTVSKEEGYHRMKTCSRIDICAVPHTAYIAKMLQTILHSVGLQSEIHLSQPEQYENIPYIMVCPQNFDQFPELYIAFQMEQTINQRWLTDRYLTILRSAYAVFDYSLVNIDYFSKDPEIAPKLYYLPIDLCDAVFKKNLPTCTNDKEYDILFYGSISSEHRQMYLQSIGKRFNLKIVTEKFGDELYEEMKKAKIIINVHYYEGALLETTRLNEILSVCDALIISERSNDPTEDSRLENIVDFVDIGHVDEMINRLDYWLTHDDERKAKVKKNQEVFKNRANAAKFYTLRFLLANDIIDFDYFYKEAGDYVHFTTNRQCLSLPETTVRRASFNNDNKYGFEVFPGLKHHFGWIGCGMSYKFMFKKAIEQKLDNILICEDDTYFPDDFEKRFEAVLQYTGTHDDWNIFSGIMADIGRVSVLDYVKENTEEFVYLNRMISMVFNLYDKSIFELIANWDNTNHNIEMNTIDRYLESKSLRILTTCPFLVGHKEDLNSTLWGASNTIYSELIGNSSNKLKALTEEYQKSLVSAVPETEVKALSN